jgi:putative ABC transport system ATP-binding protein
MVIECRNVNLIYDVNTGEEKYALKAVNLYLESHSHVGITGPSGSGKSSLLYILSGLKKPSSGTIFFDDVDISTLSREESTVFRRKHFGFIFQNSFLIDYMDVINNVLVVVNENNSSYKSKALNLLKLLNIDHLANKKPSQLSGGQRQKVAVARALINDPSVIFADEPTASMDTKSALELMCIFNELENSPSLFLVTHDRTLLQGMSRTINLRDGRIINPAVK